MKFRPSSHLLYCLNNQSISLRLLFSHVLPSIMLSDRHKMSVYKLYFENIQFQPCHINSKSIIPNDFSVGSGERPSSLILMVYMSSIPSFHLSSLPFYHPHLSIELFHGKLIFSLCFFIRCFLKNTSCFLSTGKILNMF